MKETGKRASLNSQRSIAQCFQWNARLRNKVLLPQYEFEPKTKNFYEMHETKNKIS